MEKAPQTLVLSPLYLVVLDSLLLLEFLYLLCEEEGVFVVCALLGVYAQTGEIILDFH